MNNLINELTIIHHQRRRKHCKKRRYLTEEVANIGLNEVRTYRISEGEPVGAGKCGYEDHAYQCPSCGYWHLTSMTDQAYEEAVLTKALAPSGFPIHADTAGRKMFWKGGFTPAVKRYIDNSFDKKMRVREEADHTHRNERRRDRGATKRGSRRNWRLDEG
ncbi:hypothetical protein [Frateuria sp. Soil773]|uniref:hypothetical protein n=1 Tax=Frateuria sp. Soil773 TaxID=1736407 RepID=UPI0012F7E477|nr:hypothetical protein [Frateuria sp. Soil773]